MTADSIEKIIADLRRSWALYPPLKAADRLEALLKDNVVVHKDVVRFLTGRGSIKDRWFGDKVGGKLYWWCSMLPYVPSEDEIAAAPKDQV